MFLFMVTKLAKIGCVGRIVVLKLICLLLDDFCGFLLSADY